MKASIPVARTTADALAGEWKVAAALPARYRKELMQEGWPDGRKVGEMIRKPVSMPVSDPDIIIPAMELFLGTPIHGDR